MGELQTFTRAEIREALGIERSARKPAAAAPAPKPPRPVRAPRGLKGRPRALPPGGGPVVDIDMGIGREYGYRDPWRLGQITVRTHPAIPKAADPVAMGAAMARIRLAAGVTQDAVAQMLCTTNEIVSRWERGLLPAPSHVRATWADVCARAATAAAGKSGRPRRRRPA